VGNKTAEGKKKTQKKTETAHVKFSVHINLLNVP